MKKIFVIFQGKSLSIDDLNSYFPNGNKLIYEHGFESNLKKSKENVYNLINKINNINDDRDIFILIKSHFELYSYGTVMLNRVCKGKEKTVPYSKRPIIAYEYYDKINCITKKNLLSKNMADSVMSDIMNDFYSVLNYYESDDKLVRKVDKLFNNNIFEDKNGNIVICSTEDGNYICVEIKKSLEINENGNKVPDGNINFNYIFSEKEFFWNENHITQFSEAKSMLGVGTSLSNLRKTYPKNYKIYGIINSINLIINSSNVTEEIKKLELYDLLMKYLPNE